MIKKPAFVYYIRFHTHFPAFAYVNHERFSVSALIYTDHRYLNCSFRHIRSIYGERRQVIDTCFLSLISPDHLLLIQSFFNVCPNLFNRLIGINRLNQPFFLIIIQNGPGLILVFLQTHLQAFNCIIFTLIQ